jgi:hypothetical protein
MEPTIRHDFRLFFNSHRGELQRFNIPHADSLAEGPAINAAMLGIIAADVIETARGRPSTVNGAQLVTTQRTPFEI